jgi:hypothetical protein
MVRIPGPRCSAVGDWREVGDGWAFEDVSVDVEA